jgi:hypothetical protein
LIFELFMLCYYINKAFQQFHHELLCFFLRYVFFVSVPDIAVFDLVFIISVC